MASLKVEICLKKKNPPELKFFRYFSIESRNKKKTNITFSKFKKNYRAKK